jgi:hypothetical protein
MVRITSMKPFALLRPQHLDQKAILDICIVRCRGALKNPFACLTLEEAKVRPPNPSRCSKIAPYLPRFRAGD